MKFNQIKQCVKTTIMVLSANSMLISPIFAKNGPLPHGIGSQFGLGGAGTAVAIEASNADANPAVLTRLDTQLSAFLINLFQTQSLDSSTAPIGNPVGKQTNQLKNSPAAVLGGNYAVNDKWAIGFATSGGATNIKYNAATINPTFLVPANSVFQNEFINTVMLLSPTVAYQPTPEQSYGIGVILGYQTLKTNLATFNNQQTTGAGRVDSATGIGARIGGLWKLNSLVSVGASAATPVRFSQFKKYLDVLPYQFDTPAMFRLGLAFHIYKTDLLFDVKQINFASVKSLSTGLGWKNQTVFMVGIQHHLTPTWVLTAGYNYGNSPVRSNNVLINGLTDSIARHHFAVGARYQATKHFDVIASAEMTPTSTYTDNGTGILGTSAKGARLKNSDIGILLGAVYHFGK